MASAIIFPVQDVNMLRNRATDAWADRFPEELPEGWSVSTLDLRPFLAVFPPLALKPGYTLRAYQFYYHRDGNTVVWALPETAVFPPPDPQADDDPPAPPEALDNVMAAITGDETPWSYLCASILSREINEVGTFGHGSEWAADHLLGASPWDANGQTAYTSPDQGPTGSANAWQWHTAEPENWQPAVYTDAQQITVAFYTYSGLGMQTITRHTDFYKPGSYIPLHQQQVVASGPQGFVW
ncbi:MAG: hypothetical protein R3E31_12920 [Chloroflexota bacterium]|nr:hypothetical protein [Ardenticatenaceae bacterium]